MEKLNEQVKNLFNEQVANWPLARTNFEGLKTIKTKTFQFNDFEIRVQFNPARIVSSGAKVDAASIAKRKCFLCSENRPEEQNGIEAGDYFILVNPFPIFPEHFTITHKKHIDQAILPYISDMMELAQAMDDYLIFYNGPQCGASAPDHFHFQAGTKDYLPLVNDYKRLKSKNAELLVESESFQLYNFTNYQRTVYCIESKEIQSATHAFENLYRHFQKENDVEPMMNVICTYEESTWTLFVIPRKTFRPWQYSATGRRQMMISPATVEMSGIFITPVENDFNKITKHDIISILEQVSY